MTPTPYARAPRTPPAASLWQGSPASITNTVTNGFVGVNRSSRISGNSTSASTPPAACEQLRWHGLTDTASGPSAATWRRHLDIHGQHIGPLDRLQQRRPPRRDPRRPRETSATPLFPAFLFQISPDFTILSINVNSTAANALNGRQQPPPFSYGVFTAQAPSSRRLRQLRAPATDAGVFGEDNTNRRHRRLGSKLRPPAAAAGVAGFGNSGHPASTARPLPASASAAATAAATPAGYAGYFNGQASTSKAPSTATSKSFKIDHPLRPRAQVPPPHLRRIPRT